MHEEKIRMKKSVRINIKGTRWFPALPEGDLHDCVSALSEEGVLPCVEDQGGFCGRTGHPGRGEPGSEPLTEEELEELLTRALAEAADYKPTTELDTLGEMMCDDGAVTLSYDESEITGMAGCRTTIRIDNNGIASFSRSGAVNSHMIFEDKKRYFCVSDSPEDIPVCIMTNDLVSSLNEDGGELYIDYCVEVGGAKAEHSKFEIKVR